MEFVKFHRIIPTYDNGTWTETEFTDIIIFRDFVKSTFKEPGKYELDGLSKLFNEQARIFRKQQDIYCLDVHMSKDFIKYWDHEKQKNIVFRILVVCLALFTIVDLG